MSISLSHTNTHTKTHLYVFVSDQLCETEDKLSNWNPNNEKAHVHTPKSTSQFRIFARNRLHLRERKSPEISDYLNETIAKALSSGVESLLRPELQWGKMRTVLGVVDDIPRDFRSFTGLRVRLRRDFLRKTSRSLPIGV